MSSLKDLASLIMIPSLVKDGRLDTVKPLGNSIIHPDATGNNDGTDGSTPAEGNFTFTRGSNLSATRVDASQLIEKGRENNYLYSQQLDNNVWAKAKGSITANATTAPNSTLTADLFTEDTTNGSHDIRQVFSSTSGAVYTTSIYIKANGRSILTAFAAGPSKSVTFNLSTESASGNAISQKIEAAGNGWYRCSFSVQTVSTALNVIWILNNGSTSYQGDGVSGMYFWGAQLEQGLVATPYIETGASTAQAGILENTPRLDYSGGATCPSLLLEPSRTNLIPQSEYFNSSYWIKSGSPTVSVSDNAGISPEGVSNATRFVAASAQQSTRLYTSVTWTAVPYTLSLYVKNNGGTNTNLRFSYYDSTGQYFSPTFTLTDEWQRIEYTFTPTASSGGFWIVNTPTGGLNLDLLAFAAQLEVGSYATSYIPTYGVSQTRAQDNCSNLSLTTSTDFTIFFEAKDFCLINGSTGGSYDNVQFVFSPSGGPYDGGGSYHIYGNSLYYYNGSTNTSFGLIYNNQTDSKFALVKRGNQGILYANGVKKTELTLPSGADAKVINWDAINLTSSLTDGQGDVFGSKYQQLLKFDTALSDVELASLTTI